MVKLHVKKGDESLFLFETKLTEATDTVIEELTHVYNGCLKVRRICCELEDLGNHGTFLPPNMQGLTDEQIQELCLKDEWGEKCTSEGSQFNKDPVGRRNGMQPSEKNRDVLDQTKREALALISKDLVKNDACVTLKMVSSALDILRGAVMIVYPMGLPPYDPIRLELENNEDLSGTQASLEVVFFYECFVVYSGRFWSCSDRRFGFVGRKSKGGKFWLIIWVKMKRLKLL